MSAGRIGTNERNVEEMNVQNAKCLVAYFSHSGNTRVIAHEIQAHVGGDIFEIVPVGSLSPGL